MHNHNFQAKETSGTQQSYWLDTEGPIAFSALTHDLQVEVLVIGGGISGMSVAYALAKEGRQVVLIEDGLIGSGETGRTTAHLTNALDDRYYEIERSHGQTAAKQAAESHTAAIEFIEHTIMNEHIACDFLRLPGYLFLHPSDHLSNLKKELEATQRAGLKTTFLPTLLDWEHLGPCLAFPNQAQFHPMKYLRGLSKAIIQAGGSIYTQTKAKSIQKEQVVANTNRIQAKHIVVATNSPINSLITIHTKQFAYRTYVIGALLEKTYVKQPALWWDTGDQGAKWATKPYHYLRLQNYSESHYLAIVGGQDHRTGQGGEEKISPEDRYKNLANVAKTYFPAIQDVIYRWSGQVMEPLDEMAYIGRSPGDEHVYVVTGDSGNGMTHGTLAGILIPDLIAGRSNPWEKLYAPSRITLSTAKDYLQENASTLKHYADYVTPGDLPSIKNLESGKGAILRCGIKKYAVYRKDDQTIQAYSAVCPHLGCIVHWNEAEQTFDCPCHGSRFSSDGKVMNGPALSNLSPIDQETIATIK